MQSVAYVYNINALYISLIALTTCCAYFIFLGDISYSTENLLPFFLRGHLNTQLINTSKVQSEKPVTMSAFHNADDLMFKPLLHISDVHFQCCSAGFLLLYQ